MYCMFQIHRSMLWPQGGIWPALLPWLDADIVEAQEGHRAAPYAYCGRDCVLHYIPWPALHPWVGRNGRQGASRRCPAPGDDGGGLLPCSKAPDEEASQEKQLCEWCAWSLTYSKTHCCHDFRDMLMLKIVFSVECSSKKRGTQKQDIERFSFFL